MKYAVRHGERELEAEVLPTDTPGVFEVLGVSPLVGRALDESDDFADGTGVALLSYELWTRRYGRDPLPRGGRRGLRGHHLRRPRGHRAGGQRRRNVHRDGERHRLTE